MRFDLAKATTFMTTHARLLDRQRFTVITGAERPGGALSALAGYRNDDGGFGWGLEPDLRSPESQPVGALHAFEVFEDIAPHTSDLAVGLCDWLASVTRPDGGLPFALPIGDPTGTSPIWQEADTESSSLHLTTAIAGIAHRVARHDPGVRDHPWLARATDYCWRRIVDLRTPAHNLELRYILWFLDALHEVNPDAEEQLRRLGALIPASGIARVEGGLEDEAMRPLDFSPLPNRPLRNIIAPQAIEADLDRLAAEQRADGGWDVDWESPSIAGTLEWRGWATVRAVTILLAHK